MSKNVYEYIWQDKHNNFRSKSKVYTEKHGSSLRNLITPSVDSVVPLWNFDGSSTEQANGSD